MTKTKVKRDFETGDRRVAIQEALGLLGVTSYNSWQTWLARGLVKIPLQKDGGKWFVRKSDIDKIVRGDEKLLYTKAEAAARLAEKKASKRPARAVKGAA